MKPNDIQNQLLENLEIYAPKWWGRNEAAERVYFNSGLMSGIKVWIQFADAATLAGAEIKARWNGAQQHPNWVKATEAQWAEKFSAALESIKILRDQFELSAEQENEVLEKKAEFRAQIDSAIKEVVEQDIAAAQIEKSIIAAGATELSEIKTAHGNVDVRAGVPAAFAHVKFSEAFKFLVSTKTKATENKWFKLAAKGGQYLPALIGFYDKTAGRPGHTYPTTVAVIDGVVCKKSDEAAIRTAVAVLENEAEPLLKTSAYGQFLRGKIRGGIFTGSGAPGFVKKNADEVWTAASGKNWKCVASGDGWYVAVES